MSAGDVLFVGWTGGSPKFKELIPNIRYEPVNETGSFTVNNQTTNFAGNYTRKIVMRRVICFSKELDDVISLLLAYSGNLKSVYLDTDGSVKELDLGPGWKLLTYDSSEYAVGYSIVQVSYEKTVERATDTGLPAGMSIVCANGICSIKYNGTTLEELDSGTGQCTTGFNIKYTRLPRPADPFEAQAAELIRASIVCNDVEFDSLGILGSEIPQTETVISENNLTNIWGSRTTEVQPGQLAKAFGIFDQKYFLNEDYDNAQEAFNAALIYHTNKLEELKQFTPEEQIAVEGIRQLFQDNEYIKYSNFLAKTEISTSQVAYNLQFQFNPFEPNVITPASFSQINGTKYLSYSISTTYPSSTYTPSAFWEKDGNIIRLKVLDKIWRQYDVTGL